MSQHDDMPDLQSQVEGRDWIGNPDGTLEYWQAEADEARAELERRTGIATRLELELINDAFEEALNERSFVGLAGTIDRFQAWREKYGMTYEPFEGSETDK